MKGTMEGELQEKGVSLELVTFFFDFCIETLMGRTKGATGKQTQLKDRKTHHSSPNTVTENTKTEVPEA